jgi:hypothetical protein
MTTTRPIIPIILMSSIFLMISCAPRFISDCFKKERLSVSLDCDEPKCAIPLCPIDLSTIESVPSMPLELVKGQYMFGILLEHSFKEVRMKNTQNPTLAISIYDEYGKQVRKLSLEISEEEITRGSIAVSNGYFLCAGQFAYIPPSQPSGPYFESDAKGPIYNHIEEDPPWLISYPILDILRPTRCCVVVEILLSDSSFAIINSYLAVMRDMPNQALQRTRTASAVHDYHCSSSTAMPASAEGKR